MENFWDNVLEGWAWQVKEEFVELLSFLDKLPVGHILEIGSYDGGTARGFLELGWRVTCIEKHPRERLLKLAEDYPKDLTLIEGDSSELLVDKRKKFDVLFIDGDHSYEMVKSDYDLYSPLVRNKGLIIFHDIVDSELHREQGCAVPQFWKELEGNKKEIIRNGTWGGIGLLQK